MMVAAGFVFLGIASTGVMHQLKLGPFGAGAGKPTGGLLAAPSRQAGAVPPITATPAGTLPEVAQAAPLAAFTVSETPAGLTALLPQASNVLAPSSEPQPLIAHRTVPLATAPTVPISAAPPPPPAAAAANAMSAPVPLAPKPDDRAKPTALANTPLSTTASFATAGAPIGPDKPAASTGDGEVKALKARIDLLTSRVETLNKTVADMQARSSSSSSAPVKAVTQQSAPPKPAVAKAPANAAVPAQPAAAPAPHDNKEVVATKPTGQVPPIVAGEMRAPARIGARPTTSGAASAPSVGADEGWGYTIHGITNERAWLKARDGNIYSVAVGDTLVGLGIVREINSQKEEVVFSNGAIIK